jgi:hypothetical protein
VFRQPRKGDTVQVLVVLVIADVALGTLFRAGYGHGCSDSKLMFSETCIMQDLVRVAMKPHV